MQGVPQRSSQHAVELLDVDRSFTSRHLNDGFSGGEKKRAEILQMAMLRPDIAILDETDSGLDIDALRTVAEGVQRLHDEQGLGALIITHYQRILHYVEPQFVHILMDGRIVLEGGVELVERLEREGYDQIRQEVGAARWPVTTVSEPRAGAASSAGTRTARPPSTTRSHGAGAGDGRTPRGAARAAPAPPTRASSCPCGGARASGRRAFRTSTSRRSSPTPRRRAGTRAGECPEVVTRTLPERSRAGRLVQGADGIVQRRARPGAGRARRDPVLAGGGLPRAHRARRALVLQAPADRPPQARGRERRVLERRRLPVRARRAWSWRSPSRSSTRSSGPGVAQYGRTLVVGAAGSEFRVHEYDLAEDFGEYPEARQALHAGAFELYLAGRRPLPAGAGPGLGRGRGATTSPRASWASAGTPTATGCRRCSAATWCASTSSWPSSEPGGEMAFRGHVLHRGARAPGRVRRRPPRDRPLRAATSTGAGPRPARAGRASRV